MYKKAILVLVLAIMGCTPLPKSKEVPKTTVEQIITERKVVIDTACDWVRPLYISNKDGLTAGTARQILAHNETWEARCQKIEKQK